jgi:hypothetical protein
VAALTGHKTRSVFERYNIDLRADVTLLNQAQRHASERKEAHSWAQSGPVSRG